MAVAEAPIASTSVETGVPVEFFLAFIETDELVTEADRAWFRDLLGTPEPRA